MKLVEDKHPLAIRWLHWVSFPLLALMIWSGLMIYWANDAYRLGWGGTTLFHFFPDKFYEVFSLPQRLAEGMALHFFFMWFFALNGLVYVIFLAISGQWRFVLPDRHSWTQAILVTLYDLHVRKTTPPQGKYNAAQRIAYSGVILMGAGSLITGLAIYKPIQVNWLTASLGGYVWARAEHFCLMIAFVLFFAVHVVQVIKAGWNNFRSMVAGNELAPDAGNSARHESAIRTRRAFATMGIAAAAGYGAWYWLRSRPEAGEMAWPFRRMLQFNQRVAELYYSENRATPVLPPALVQEARVNGDVGLGADFDAANWRLGLQQLANAEEMRHITLADIKALPRVEYTAPLKCIEGWSNVIKWTGVRFSDFTQKFAPESVRASYVSLHTPDEEYFVGLDMASALHPQTLLCYEMNGEPLTSDHGAPLRLVIPVKYGIKNIKRIGAIAYTAERPRDYWAEEGYDWYAGL